MTSDSWFQWDQLDDVFADSKREPAATSQIRGDMRIPSLKIDHVDDVEDDYVIKQEIAEMIH